MLCVYVDFTELGMLNNIYNLMFSIHDATKLSINCYLNIYIYINFPDIFIFKQPTLLYYVLQYDYTLSYKLMFVKNKFIADSTKICTYTHSRLNTYFRYNMHTYFTHYIYIHSIHYIHIHSIHYIYIHNIHYGVLADYISIITMHYYYSVQIR